jgi:hypothetical protein
MPRLITLDSKSKSAHGGNQVSRYKSDDGTFWMGLFAAGMAIVGFCAGYTLRDNGYVFNATNQAPISKEVKPK